MNSFITIAAIAYTQEITKTPLAVSSRRVFKYMVSNTTLAKSANVESADKIVFCDKIRCIKSPTEKVG